MNLKRKKFLYCTKNNKYLSRKIYITLSTPLNILPPATPPFKSSTSQPGLLTSNDRITASVNKISQNKTDVS